MGSTIALRGRAGSGKTHTIGMLHELMVQNNYQVNGTTFSQIGSDFQTIFSKKGKRIGVTSRGDTYDLVMNDLREFEQISCAVYVCACRTADRTNKLGVVQGTNAAVNSFPSHPPSFIEKNVSNNIQSHLSLNHQDAQSLFQEIEARL